MTILERIVKEREHLISDGKNPDSLFLNRESLGKLEKQAQIVYGAAPESTRKEFLGMMVFVAEQYLGGKFRIYCTPQFEGEQNGS